MDKEKELSFEEQKILQLDILKEVDFVCKKRSIKYSLAFGTLLGAIRHKGYIPWDDDLDIMMPYEDMVQLKKSLRSSNLSFCDVDTSKYYENPFGNICSNNTYRKIGNQKERGLGIDVYPLVKIPSKPEEMMLYFEEAEKLQSRRAFLTKIRLFMIRNFSFCPPIGFRKSVRKYRDFLASYNSCDSSNYYIIAAPLDIRTKMIYDEDFFQDMINVDFEGLKFPAIAKYDKFLTMMYGNYMQLPPEEKRHPYHGQHYYWK